MSTEQEKGSLEGRKDARKKRLFGKPARRWWVALGLVLSLGMIYPGLGEDPWAVSAPLPAFGVPEGMGTIFGSVAELVLEDQTTLAGILRFLAGLFAVSGVLLMVLGQFFVWRPGLSG